MRRVRVIEKLLKVHHQAVMKAFKDVPPLLNELKAVNAEITRKQKKQDDRSDLQLRSDTEKEKMNWRD